MKRKIMFGAATAALVLGFSSCELLLTALGVDDDGSSYVETTAATDAVTWNYTSSNRIFKADSSVLSVNVSGNISGKTLYLVQVNPSDNNFVRKQSRQIATSSLCADVVDEESRAASENTFSEIDYSSLGTATRKHFVGEKLPTLSEIPASTDRSALDSANLSVTQISRTVGTTKKIFIDYDSSMSSYKQADATLRAVGTYCNVWIVDAYYKSTASGNKVNTAVAEKYAEAFDKMYPVITNVFGNESDKIINYDTQSVVNMETLSDTGTKVNIVIYDIGADYRSSDEVSTTGVVGYFYAKDYYYTTKSAILLGGNSVMTKSNVGKYFYIDSGYANENLDDTISTLAHEFQHMVNFGVKDLAKNQSPDTSYNEMLSMLCEDMMQEFLGLTDKEAPKSRTQAFNLYYYASGIREYRNDDYAVLSYSTSYLFGAWLCRQYGGAALVKAMMSNAYVDSASIVAAVNSVNGTNYTFDDLFQQFLLALVDDDDYTINKNATQTITYSSGSTTYKYPMKKFDIRSSDYSPSSMDGFKSSEYPSYAWSTYKNGGYLGPFLFSNSVLCDLRSKYGIQIHGIGKYASGKTSDTITFTANGAKDLELYLILE